MSSGHLFWLPPPASDLRQRLRALTAGDGPVAGHDLAFLAQHALGLEDLGRLAKALRLAGDRLDPGALTPVRFALLGDGTVDHILPAIAASALRHGVLLETYAPAYNRALPEVLDPGSGLAAFAPQIALVASDYRSLGLARPRMDPGEAAQAVASAAGRLREIVAGLAARGVTPIVQTLVPPADPWTGHYDLISPGSPAAMVRAVNAALVAAAHDHSAVVLDADAIAGLIGRAQWFDPSYWFRAKLPFAMDATPLYAEHVARLIGAMRGKARKCLVLDLDNTLWGGVIGDDGLDGIRLGQGSADGEAFVDIQAYALALKARGVVLAVVSKNEEDAARLPFREHPEMRLREDDIAVFIANWDDKASNIRHVARVLNIGLDALAFLDDNPAERARVRQMLPEVAVPEVGEDASLYPTVLARSGLFETIGLSGDDAQRAEQYRANAERNVVMEKMGDYDAYLRSLEMACDLRPFDAVGRTRIAQLANKSNQFNLTTRRYTEADIGAFQNDPAVFTLQVRLTDRFGDNGMISVIIFRKGADEWVCDTWLMSCRVLERRVEEAVLKTVAQAARAEGARRLVGEYLPSAKNKMVAGHFAKLGFVAAGAAGADGTRWTLDLDAYPDPDLPLTLTGPLAEPADAIGANA
jgi:FkbH-like protein